MSRDDEAVILDEYTMQGDLRDYWSFTVDEDLRVLFRCDGDEAFLLNIGSHDQVY